LVVFQSVHALIVLATSMLSAMVVRSEILALAATKEARQVRTLC
jgi:hypothetical protein